MSVLEAYRRALASQMQPAMLLLAIGPVVIAGLFWFAIMWWKWATVLAAVEGVLKTIPYVEAFADRLVLWGVSVIPGALLLWALGSLFVPLTLITALAFISVFGMPLMARHVARTEHGALERRSGGSLAGSLANSLIGLAWFLPLAIVTLPLWFLPLVGWLFPALLLGRLNARLLRYDAIAEHASALEIKALASQRDLGWGWLGFLGAAMNVIPFLWFFSTTLTGLAFIHYGLDALAASRRPALAKGFA
ncbi:MAG: EI24 domain-containing protein [Burkholderiales bacterium]|nr:EI24 domain-containing protein [Burkholderiales bacterium]